MASVNKAIIIGNIGKDPEIRFMPDGGQVAVINIATTEKWKDKTSGEVRERTDWHRVVLYRKLAEIAGQYLKKGNPVYIEGRLETKEYTDKQNVKRYITQIIADTLKMLGSKPSDASQNTTSTPAQAGAGSSSNATSGFDDMDDDIPF